MWPFARQSRSRRLDLHKGLMQTRAPRWTRFRQAGGPAGVLVAATFLVAVLLLDVWPEDQTPYRVGQYVPADIRVMVDRFEPPAPPSRMTASEESMNSFQIDEKLVGQIVKDLKALPGTLADKIVSTRPASQPTTSASSSPRPSTPHATSQPTSEPASQPSAAIGPPALPSDIALKWFGPLGREKYDRMVDSLSEDLRSKCIVTPDQAAAERRRQVDRVLLGTGPHPVAPKIEEILSLDQTDSLRAVLDELAHGFDAPLADEVRAYLCRVFIEQGKPLYTRIEALPSAGQAGKVPPATVYRRGDVLVRASRRVNQAGVEEVVSLTGAELDLLRAENAAYISGLKQSHPWRIWAERVGRGVLMLLVVCILGAYVWRHQPATIREPDRALLVAAVMLAMLLLSKLAASALDWNLHAALLPAAMGAMILVIAYDQRFALGMGAFLALLTMLLLRADLSLGVVLMAAVAVGAFQLHDIRTRSKLVGAATLTGIVVFALTCAEGWSAATPWRFVLTDGLWAGGATVLAGFLVQGLLPVIEKIFRTATSMTLLEWCDASKPLLKHLALRAPGTYNHSLQLGSMCESAAETIGAGGLLARTGAYYHDIGKTNKPEYFMENQAGGASKHSKLSPAMSLLIISGHVKDGLELAREYGLPEVLHEFIATHHGTTLAQYFYHAATEQARKSGAARSPDEMEFRYPGPKPHTKEAGILMLADAAESSVRSMTEPTPSRIENQVHAMVMRRLMDGQLDHCDLTLREVHAIESSLVRSLCAVHHGRTAYPTPAGEKPSAAERSVRRTPIAVQIPVRPEETDDGPAEPPAGEPRPPEPDTPTEPDASDA